MSDDVPQGDHAEGNSEHPGHHVTHKPVLHGVIEQDVGQPALPLELGMLVATRFTMMITTSTGRTTNTRATTTTESRELVKWVFLKGMKSITCEVRSNGARAFDVCVLPHWDVSSSIVEGFDDLASTMRRHAEISLAFRDAGWVLVREGRA
jgi:hypothetical protein